MYYRSANETDFGCRGAISIRKAEVKLHDYDELRFDVTVTDCTWYLRASTKEERGKWTLALQSYRFILITCIQSTCYVYLSLMVFFITYHFLIMSLFSKSREIRNIA